MGTPAGPSAAGNYTCGSGLGTTAQPEHIFEWTPATTGSASVSTSGSTSAPVVYLKTVMLCDNSAASTDLACSLSTNSFPLGFEVSAGVKYFIVVDGSTMKPSAPYK